MKRILLLACVFAVLVATPVLAKDKVMIGDKFVPTDVDWEHPAYSTTFDSSSALKDWKMEGGLRASIRDGNLLLENGEDKPGVEYSGTNLVYWLDKEMPGDFLLEFSFKPKDRKEGLAIVFFNTRGIHSESIFDPKLAQRDGTFPQYHSGDLNGYHISYWAGTRGTANLRKNKGFHLVQEGKDLIAGGPQGKFQTVRIYKNGSVIRLMVDDVVGISWEDDGKTYGPVITQPGWIGLRQMAHAKSCEYGHLKIFPLKK